MTLLKQYVRAVRTYLPRRSDQDDILNELTEHLQARLDEREEEVGRPLTELEQEEILSEHGNPALVADRYGATNRGVSFGVQLIGPELFPLYIRLLLFQLALTGVVWIVIGRFSRVVSPFAMLLTLLLQFILLTTVFSGIDRLQRAASQRRSAAGLNWRFPPSYRQPVPRWQSAGGFIVLAVVALWWSLLPRVPALVLGRAAGRLALTPEWLDFYWPVLLLLLLGITQRTITFAHPEWNWLQPVVRLLTNAGAVALTWPFLQIYPFLIATTDDARTVALAQGVSGAIWWNLLCGFSLYWFINALLQVWFCVQHLRYAMRRRRERRFHDGGKGAMTMKKTLTVVAIAFALAPSRTSAGQTPMPSGESVYRETCATCHEAGVPRAGNRATLSQMSAENIRFALTTGAMRTQATGLSPAQIDAVVAFLARPATSPAPASSASLTACAPVAAVADPLAQPHWNGWGVDVTQRRFQPAPMARLAAQDVPKLALKWAFAFPGVRQAYGQPTIVGGRIFVGSAGRKVYSLDAKTGCQHWVFDAEFPVRAAVTIDVANGVWSAYFGDQHGTAYALDALTGTLRWKRRVDDHANAVITGAPTLSGRLLYVPVSSSEEGVGSDPRYGCCKFRGSVVALDAGSGEVKWKSYTIPEEPQPRGKNAQGTQLFGPSGAAVWGSPTFDAKTRRIYVTTGDSYSDPAASTSDAFVAFDADTGKMVWSRQMTGGDAFTMACDFPDALRANCPQGNGPDHDFGSSPMLVELPGGRRALIAGQKSGMVHALDPDHEGAILWQVRVGKGGRVGGVQWGSATDGARVYVALSDAAMTVPPAGTPGAQMSMIGAPLLLQPNQGGGLFALDPQTGAVVWNTPHPGCAGVPGCSPAQSAAVTAIPGVAFSGGLDGHLRAYAAATGAILWDLDTKREYQTVNGVPGRGGAIDGPGVVVVDGMLYTNSGYSFVGGTPGNVLLAFSIDGR